MNTTLAGALAVSVALLGALPPLPDAGKPAESDDGDLESGELKVSRDEEADDPGKAP